MLQNDVSFAVGKQTAASLYKMKQFFSFCVTEIHVLLIAACTSNGGETPEFKS
jgi:hypothetical protein